MATIINKFGTVQGWNSLTVNTLGRDLEGITAINYDDTVTREQVYGAGKFPVGRSESNYEATSSITLLKEERDALLAALTPGMRIQDIPPFDITCLYARSGGQIQKDVIRNAQFTNNGVELTQGDGSSAFEFTLIVSHIDWNVPA